MPAQTDDVVAQKRVLRAAALARRDALKPVVRARAAEAIAARELPFPIYKGTVFSAYAPMRSELDPGPLIGKIRAAGGRIVLPAIVLGRIVFRLHEPGDLLVPGTFGTSEPRAEARELNPDVLLVPLAAFDSKGGRLGYGKGYYDEAIARLKQERRIGVVGLGFEAQRVDKIPLSPRDQRLDLVLTEAGAQWFSTFGKK